MDPFCKTFLLLLGISWTGLRCFLQLPHAGCDLDGGGDLRDERMES